MEHLRQVRERLQSHRMKLKPRKCKLFRLEVHYLGRTVSEDGYRPDPANLEAVVKLKDSQPQTIGDARKLLGLLGYYCRNIQNFARNAKPLVDLTNGSQESQRKKSAKRTKYQEISKTAIN